MGRHLLTSPSSVYQVPDGTPLACGSRLVILHCSVMSRNVAHMGGLLDADAQDKALIFQADAETSLLGAIRQVPNMVTKLQLCTQGNV